MTCVAPPCPSWRRARGTERHLKRCHLPDPEVVYEQEVLPEIAPDLVEER